MNTVRNLKFIVSASIWLDEERNLTLSEPISYSIENINVKISTNEEDSRKLSVAFEVETSDTDRARFIAESELLRIANFLSWEKSIPVKKFRVGSMHYSTEPGNMNAIGFADETKISARVSLSLILGPDGSSTLSKKLSKGLLVPEEIQLMWREALCEESKSLQFILYYRILEFINSNVRKGADSYIKQHEPNVVMQKGKEGEDITIYTYLRDNVHAKNPSFPYQEIERYLPKLITLVRNALEKKYRC